MIDKILQMCYYFYIQKCISKFFISKLKVLKFKKIFLFSIILFSLYIPSVSAKYIFFNEVEIKFEVEYPVEDTYFDSIILSAPDVDDNGTVFSISAKDESGIEKIEFYRDNELYKSFEYSEIVKEKNENLNLSVEEIPFYSEFYAIGIDVNGNRQKSNIVLPNYFRIYNLKDLFKFRSLQNNQEIDFEDKDLYLMNDIDLDGFEWWPIATESSPFKGIFHGNFHTISNLTMNTILHNSGLFGQNNGTITELTVTRKY